MAELFAPETEATAVAEAPATEGTQPVTETQAEPEAQAAEAPPEKTAAEYEADIKRLTDSNSTQEGRLATSLRANATLQRTVDGQTRINQKLDAQAEHQASETASPSDLTKTYKDIDADADKADAETEWRDEFGALSVEMKEAILASGYNPAGTEFASIRTAWANGEKTRNVKALNGAVAGAWKLAARRPADEERAKAATAASMNLNTTAAPASAGVKQNYTREDIDAEDDIEHYKTHVRPHVIK